MQIRQPIELREVVSKTIAKMTKIREQIGQDRFSKRPAFL